MSQWKLSTRIEICGRRMDEWWHGPDLIWDSIFVLDGAIEWLRQRLEWIGGMVPPFFSPFFIINYKFKNYNLVLINSYNLLNYLFMRIFQLKIIYEFLNFKIKLNRENMYLFIVSFI